MGYSALARSVIANNGMARLAKPRGGRRPGALRPPASPSPGLSQQQPQNSFGEGDRINVNGIQQQQGGFTFGQQPNGYQSNQNSVSFPPFPSNSFNPSFAAPTAGFNFSAGQAEVNNPFTAINTHNAPPPEPTGFQGSIFNIPPQKMSPFQKFLEGEQKPLFAPGAPDFSASSPAQPLVNFFDQSTNQQQSSQSGPGMFSQSIAQQQPSNNAFVQSTEQTAPQPSADIFAHLKTPQISSSNPFAQSISQFQQSQSAQPTANLFAHLGQPQPSSSFLTQGPTSPTQGGSSMMQTSPDPSPQSRPFGFLNQSSTQTQSSPTKNSTTDGGGGSLFDRISKPPAETNSESQSSPIRDTAVQSGGGSLFDRISKPSAEANAQTLFSPTKNNTATDSSNLFDTPQQPDTSQVSNENRAASPTKISERKIAKPTLSKTASEDAHPSYKAIFGNLKMPPVSEPSPSPAPSAFPTFPQPSTSQSVDDFTSPSRVSSDVPSSSVSTQQQSNHRPKETPSIRRKFGPPPAPEGYSGEEARKWSQDWWISFYVRHKEKRIKHVESQCDKMIEMVQDGRYPLEQIVGSKRKPVTEIRKGEEDETQGKKARFGGPSIFTHGSRGVSSNGTGMIQSPPTRETPVQQVTNENNKRSADEEPQRDNAQGTANNGKKTRVHDPVSYPPLPSASPDSQTSSIFKNILDKKEEAKVNGTQEDRSTSLLQFQAPSGSSSTQWPSTSKPSSVPLSSKPDTESPFESSSASFNPASSTSSSRLFASEQSISNSAPANTSISSFKPSTSATAPSTASNPGPFPFKSTTSSEAPSDATKAFAVKFSSGATTSTASKTSPFSAEPTASGQTSSQGAKAPAFEIQPFGAAAATSTASNSSPFSTKPSTNAQTSSEASKAPAFKVPTFGAAASSKNASNSSPFSVQPSTSAQTSSEASKAPAFKVPTFGTASSSNASTSSPFSVQPSTSAQTSSEASKAPAFKVPTFGTTASSNASNSSPFSTIAQTSSEASKAPAFKVPTFGAGASSTNYIAQFGKAAEKTAAEEKKKRKAADYDSDEEDLVSWERRDAEEQQMKKQKLEDEIKGKAAKLIDGKWVIAADSKKPRPSAYLGAVDPMPSVLSLTHGPLTNGDNIFGHLSGEESGVEGSKTGDADDEDDEDEKDEINRQNQVRGPFDYDESQSESDEDEGQPKEPRALSNPFGASENGLYETPFRNNHGTAGNANGEDSGRSMFDRISRDKDGKPVREIPQADGVANSKTSNVFGQSFKSSSSSNPFSQPSDAASIFTSANSKIGESPKGDHTWKADSPIKFGDSSNPPAVNVTSPSPSKQTFGGLFGAAKPNTTTETQTKPTSSVFGTPPAKTPSVGFGFGFKPATASLAPPFNTGSNTTSRATSPGATTGESANESTADGEDEKAEKQEQIDLTSPGPGEENDDVVMQVKAKALKWETKTSTWAIKGVGPLRVLKNRESHQTRVLLRQDPSGRIVLNFPLSKSFTYESSQNKAVRVPIVGESGKIESWIIKVGIDDDAKNLASALQENKS